MTIQLIEQKRAAYALKKVQQVSKKEQSEWKTRANEMPAMIQMNGLGQAAAFYLSKSGVHKKIYDLLSDWLCNNADKNLNIYNTNNLIEGITKGDMETYRAAQAEAQALLTWLKKFSNAYCADEKE